MTKPRTLKTIEPEVKALRLVKPDDALKVIATNGAEFFYPVWLIRKALLNCSKATDKVFSLQGVELRLNFKTQKSTGLFNFRPITAPIKRNVLTFLIAKGE